MKKEKENLLPKGDKVDEAIIFAGGWTAVFFGYVKQIIKDYFNPDENLKRALQINGARDGAIWVPFTHRKIHLPIPVFGSWSFWSFWRLTWKFWQFQNTDSMTNTAEAAWEETKTQWLWTTIPMLLILGYQLNKLHEQYRNAIEVEKELTENGMLTQKQKAVLEKQKIDAILGAVGACSAFVGANLTIPLWNYGAFAGAVYNNDFNPASSKAYTYVLTGVFEGFGQELCGGFGTDIAVRVLVDKEILPKECLQQDKWSKYLPERLGSLFVRAPTLGAAAGYQWQINFTAIQANLAPLPYPSNNATLMDVNWAKMVAGVYAVGFGVMAHNYNHAKGVVPLTGLVFDMVWYRFLESDPKLVEDFKLKSIVREEVEKVVINIETELRVNEGSEFQTADPESEGNNKDLA